MWRDFNKVSDIVDVASVWLLTLEKQGCSTMLKAGTVLHLFYLLAVILVFIGVYVSSLVGNCCSCVMCLNGYVYGSGRALFWLYNLIISAYCHQGC